MYDDKSETIYMKTTDFVTKVDWDSKNVDFVSNFCIIRNHIYKFEAWFRFIVTDLTLDPVLS